MSAAPTNPLIDDRDVELILDEVLDLRCLLGLPYFADHDRETCELVLASARELAGQSPRGIDRGGLVDSDVAVTGLIHKIGWRGLPSLALACGERGDCRGWLVGEPHQGIRYMFQMAVHLRRRGAARAVRRRGQRAWSWNRSSWARRTTSPASCW